MLMHWENGTKKRFYLAVALVLVLVLSGGTFAYTYVTNLATVGIATPTGDVATSNASASQPDWSSITDNLSANTTCGEVPAGYLFDLAPHSDYAGDLQVGVYLTNTASLVKAYQYLNMKVYLEGSASANQTPDYQLLSLQNGRANFYVQSLGGSQQTWTQTSQADFEGGTLSQLDTTTSSGDVILDRFGDSVTDGYDDQTKIASSANVVVSGSQVTLDTYAGTSDNETIRPSAAGDETNIAEQSPATGAHWDKVDEAVSDGDGTYVQTNTSGWEEDLYNVANPVTGSGTINYVKAYIVARSLATPAQTSAYVHIKTNGAEYNGTAQQVTTSYAPYSQQWNTNPQTGSAWTWSEVNSLQAGAGLRRATATGAGGQRYTRLTQVYIEVNYTPQIYYARGTATSVNLLAGEQVVSIDDFQYNASAIPAATSLKVQFSADNSTWYNSAGTADGWDTLSAGTDNISLATLGWSGPNLYYNMEFTSDGSDTPVLEEIRVYFSTYYASGDLTSSTHDGGDYTDWDWETISFTIVEPASTDIKFQLRSAATEGGLSSATWYGPTGTGDYYTTSTAGINPVHDGDRWLQYQAYFSGPGGSTPTLSDVTIAYTVPLQSFTIEITGGSYCLNSDNTSEWAAGWTVTPEFYSEVSQR
jgi:hypothetical protein